MSKKNQNVFEKVAEKLDNVLEELQTTNNILYAIGSEMFDIGDKIDILSAKVDEIISAPIDVTLTEETIAKLIKALTTTEAQLKAEIPSMTFEKRGEK